MILDDKDQFRKEKDNLLEYVEDMRKKAHDSETKENDIQARY